MDINKIIKDMTTSDVAKGGVNSSGSFSATLTDAETYYPLINTNLVATQLHHFDYNQSTGELTFTKGSGGCVVFLGDADISSDTINVKLTFCIFVNGTEYPYSCTPTDITATNRTKNIGINRGLNLEPNDKITVRVKSDIAGVVLTVNSFHNTNFEIFTV